MSVPIDLRVLLIMKNVLRRGWKKKSAALHCRNDLPELVNAYTARLQYYMTLLSPKLLIGVVVLFTGLFATVSRNVPTKLSNQM